MKTLINKNKWFLAIAVVAIATAMFTRCSKDNTVTALNGTTLPGKMTIDAKWTHDQVHSNIQWASKYYDFSETMLTGRINNFNFKPALVFNDSDLSKCSINMWAQMSTYNTGQPGRDGLGKCGLNYLGITYLDSTYKSVDPKSDTAWFHSTKVVRSGSGYIVYGNFTFNRYRGVDGKVDGTPITHPMTMYLTYNGVKDFLTGSGPAGKYRAGLTGSFSFNRSDYMDKASTKPYVVVPTKADAKNNELAAANKTYGVWSASTADKIDVLVNIEMYKNH